MQVLDVTSFKEVGNMVNDTVKFFSLGSIAVRVLTLMLIDRLGRVS